MVPSDDVFAGASAMQEGTQRQLRWTPPVRSKNKQVWQWECGGHESLTLCHLCCACDKHFSSATDTCWRAQPAIVCNMTCFCCLPAVQNASGSNSLYLEVGSWCGANKREHRFLVEMIRFFFYADCKLSFSKIYKCIFFSYRFRRRCVIFKLGFAFWRAIKRIVHWKLYSLKT